jgi:hypothetical protein
MKRRKREKGKRAKTTITSSCTRIPSAAKSCLALKAKKTLDRRKDLYP